MDCRCALTSHLFAHTVSRHFDYEGEAAFRRAHAAYLSSLGTARAEALIAELNTEAKRRASLEPDARARAAAIRKGWPRVRPELYALDESRWLDPRFAEIAKLARAAVSPEAGNAPAASPGSEATREFERAAAQLGLRRIEALSPVYELPVLSPEFCSALCAELSSFEESGLPMGRPNSMNRHGLLLSELGFGPLLDELLAGYVQPLAALLYPHAGGGSLDSHRAFTVKYRPGPDEQLSRHYDNAEVTLNVCIGQLAQTATQGGGGEGGAELACGFEGGEIVFSGLNLSGSPQQPSVAVGHSVGRGLLHVGAQMHQALPVTEGERVNVIIWCRSEAYRKQHGCPLCGRTDQLLPDDDDEAGECGACAEQPAADNLRAQNGAMSPDRGALAAAGENGPCRAVLPSAEQIAEFMKG